MKGRREKGGDSVRRLLTDCYRTENNSGEIVKEKDRENHLPEF